MKCRLVSKVILCLPSLFSFLVLRYFKKHRMFALVRLVRVRRTFILNYWSAVFTYTYTYTQHLEFVNKAVLSSFSVQLLRPSHVRVS